MNQTSPSKSFLLAIAAFAGTALLLFPIVYFVFDNYFKLYLFSSPPPDEWKNNLIVLVTGFLWIVLSTGIGGYVQAIKSTSREHIFVFVPFFAGIIGIVNLSQDGSGGAMLALVIVIFIGIIGSFAGSYYGAYKKKRAARQKIS